MAAISSRPQCVSHSSSSSAIITTVWYFMIAECRTTRKWFPKCPSQSNLWWSLFISTLTQVMSAQTRTMQLRDVIHNVDSMSKNVTARPLMLVQYSSRLQVDHGQPYFYHIKVEKKNGRQYTDNISILFSCLLFLCNIASVYKSNIAGHTFITLRSRHKDKNGRQHADELFKFIFLKIVLRLKCHWNVFLIVWLTRSHHWFRQQWINSSIR